MLKIISISDHPSCNATWRVIRRTHYLEVWGCLVACVLQDLTHPDFFLWAYLK